MRSIKILFISLLFSSRLFSQDVKPLVNTDSSSAGNTTTVPAGQDKWKTPLTEKVHFTFQTGMSFFSMGKQSVFDKWVAPALNYNFTPKLHLSVGTVAMFSNFSTFQHSLNNEGNKTFSQNTINGQYFLFAQGEYLLNDRVTLRGAILKEVPNNATNPYALNINRVEVDYKVSDHFTISADCMVIKGCSSAMMRNNNEFNLPAFP